VAVAAEVVAVTSNPFRLATLTIQTHTVAVAVAVVDLPMLRTLRAALVAPHPVPTEASSMAAQVAPAPCQPMALAAPALAAQVWAAQAVAGAHLELPVVQAALPAAVAAALAMPSAEIQTLLGLQQAPV
jgi:hypothetical protein